MKISNIEFVNRECQYDNIKIDVESTPLFELLDLESEDLKYIVFKEFYQGDPTTLFLDKMIYTQCLATLLQLEIIEDKTILDEVFEPFFIDAANSFKILFNFETRLYDPYMMDFDRNRLKLEDDGSYTLNGVECVESNNRTSNYFRDLLLLSDPDDNILMLNNESNLNEMFDNHKFITHELNDSTILAEDKLGDYLSEYTDYCSSYDTAYNILLVELLSNNESDTNKVLETINDYNLSDRLLPINYNEFYLNVVQLKSMKMKSPQILFQELMESTNEDDIMLGLIKLGFKID